MDIYFDFNDPIRTNEVFHTIGQPFDEDVLNNVFDFYPNAQAVKVYPNPFSNSTNIDLEDAAIKDGAISVYDARGSLVRSQNFTGNFIEFDRADLKSGIY